jgi:hypothetical protein
VLSEGFRSARPRKQEPPGHGASLLRAPGMSVPCTGSGIAWRPAGLGWDRFYDAGVYNLPNLFAAAACWVAGSRVPRERLVWRLLALPLACNLASLMVLAIG